MITRRLRIFAVCLLVAIAAVNGVLGVSSYWRYTSAGFDFEWLMGEQQVRERHVRIRWDAGSVWAGWSDTVHASDDGPLDWFDPGGSILKRTQPKRPATLMNRIGFWLVRFDSRDPVSVMQERGTLSSRMIAVPWWVVSMALAGLPIWSLRQRRRVNASGDFVPA